MSEVLRELVVELSLDSDNFSRNMRTINQQIKEAESTFRLAGAGVDKFETSVKGTESKLALLSDKLREQNRAVEQYSRALVAANKKLADSYERQEKMKSSLADARVEYDRLTSAVERARSKYNLYSASLGENDSVTIALKGNLDALIREQEEAAKSENHAFIKNNNATFIATAEKLISNIKKMIDEIDAANQKPKKVRRHWRWVGGYYVCHLKCA